MAYIDNLKNLYIGKTYGCLTIVDLYKDVQHGDYRVSCKCSCGKECSTTLYNITSGRNISCGHMHSEHILKAIMANKKPNKFEYIENSNYTLIKVQASNDPTVYFTVDTITWFWLHRFTWKVSQSGYMRTKIFNKQFFYHNIILSCPEGYTRDHIDRNPLNNTYDNLRVVSFSANGFNKDFNKTGEFPAGIRKHNDNLFTASFGRNNVRYFKTKEEAIKQRQKWEQEYQINELKTPHFILPDGTINLQFPIEWYSPKFYLVWYALGIIFLPWPISIKLPNRNIYQYWIDLSFLQQIPLDDEDLEQ